MANDDASNRMVSGEGRPEDDGALDRALRPQTLDDLIGQDKVRDNLRTMIQAARGRGEALDHILVYGPPGLGKTTLSLVVGNEMGAAVRVTSGPAIERAGDLAAILTNLRANDILFIDEIHRLNRAVEEILYPAMEDYALDIVIGKGPSARSVRLKLPAITVVGATTRLALMTAPLRARFGATFRVDFYPVAAIEKIVSRAAGLLNTPMDRDALTEVARRARGTPRVALRLLKRVRDYAQVKGDGRVTAALADEALDLLEVDPLGLDDLDRRVLRTIIEKFSGGPVGLETIAASISEESDTIMDVVEPYLLQLGFLDRTPRGRVATARAYEHLGFPPPLQPSLL
jgi:Holliday junction DNA helicase RuvB